MPRKHLAEVLGLTFQQVQKYEREASRISASMLVRAAQKLDTIVGYAGLTSRSKV
jgi:transcriptional regulator with XRE-family HTH domain